MKLTLHTDYSLRVLMYLGLHPDRLCSIAEIAKAHHISQSHLTKVVHRLGKEGLVTTLRGRSGGIRLARPADEIGVGEVVRKMEDRFDALDCGECLLLPACSLTSALGRATQAFLTTLDDYRIADLIGPAERMRGLLARRAPEAAIT